MHQRKSLHGAITGRWGINCSEFGHITASGHWNFSSFCTFPWPQLQVLASLHWVKQIKSFIMLLFCFLSSSLFTLSCSSCITTMALVLASFAQIHKAEKTDEPLHLIELKNKTICHPYTQKNTLIAAMAGNISWSYTGWKEPELLYPDASLHSLLSVPSQQQALHITWQTHKTDTTSGLIWVVGFGFFPL